MMSIPATSIWTAHVFERALGVGGETSSSGTALPGQSTTTTSTDAPFFTSNSQLGGDEQGNSSSRNLTKTVLEWVFAIAALLAIASVAACGYTRIRRRRHVQRRHSQGSQPSLSSDGRRRSITRTTSLPRVPTNAPIGMPLAMSAALFYPPSLTAGRYPVIPDPLPSGRRGRHARGADIDAQGRRGGARNPDDQEGDGKDDLPAYDSVGGPPKYMDVNVQVFSGIPLQVLPMQRRMSDSSEGDGAQDQQEGGPAIEEVTLMTQRLSPASTAQSSESGLRSSPPTYPANPSSSNSPPNTISPSTSGTLATHHPSD